MPSYPIFLNIKDRPCLVIGGGKVAERKVLSLLCSGAKVTVISPGLTKKLRKLAENKKIHYIPRRYRKGDLEGFFLAMSATGSKDINKRVSQEAEKLKILLNVADNPALCDFIVPSVVRRGSLQIAISTSGKSPYISKALQGMLEEALPRELAVFVEILGAVRNKLLKQGAKSGKKLSIYGSFLNSPVLEWIRDGAIVRLNRFLKETLGRGYSLSKLGIKWKKRTIADNG